METRKQLWRDIYGNTSDKEAELAGTYDMPYTVKPEQPKKTVVVKTAEEAEEPDIMKVAFGIVDSKPEPEPVVTHFQPYVDVSGEDPITHVIEKKAHRYALPLDERYPLDGFDQVKMASAYFDENAAFMPPEVRREFCKNMVKRANELDISTSVTAKSYAADSYAPAPRMKIALDMRRQVIENPEHLEVLNKIAEARPLVLPEDYAELLSNFDKMAGITHYYDTQIFDPFLSTFGTKEADAKGTKDDGALMAGDMYCPMKTFILFTKMNFKELKERFGPEFAKEIAKDPKGIFDSMPRDQKVILLNMANTMQGASTS